MDVPVIDISGFDSPDLARRMAVAKQWGRAFETIGFASIVGHGIPEELYDSIYCEARSFFDQPVDVKMRCHDPAVKGEGYAPVGSEAVGRSSGQAAPHDLSEALQFVNLHLGGSNRPNIWPDSLVNFRPTIEAFVLAACTLERKLMRISALALDLPETYFDQYYDRMNAKLRLVQYPDQPEPPLPGQFRNAAHTDFSGFTILRQDDAPGGLQVKIPDGEWIDVKPVRGSLVINAGDLIQRWTNDCWRSNLHRVVNPPRDPTGSTRRLSIVVFTGPNADATISCLPTCCGPDRKAKYPPINATEHSRERLRLTYEAA